ncbi:MAG: LacI family DNA-binding transcriptional regulator [Anaerolineaceae bacterium]|nr:LacI family DNA-binding transcriptional regulator [Anaerolineaceae bacterium]
MEFRRQATIAQVASEAGVSTVTVSRVINNRPDVAPDTRRRVEQVISRLGYHPNAIARSLISQHSHTLGVVASRLDYYGPSRILVGVEQKSSELGYALLLCMQHKPESEEVEPILNHLLSQQVEGVIWAVPEIGDNRVWISERAAHLRVPIIFLSMDPRSNLPVVAGDNYLGGQLATRHLLEQGCRKIGAISGPMNEWEACQRYLGWRDTLNQAGMTIESCQIFEGDWSAASGEKGARHLLANCAGLDAIFAMNDQMALGLLSAVNEAGLSVPQDLAVVGYDDMPESAFLLPPLTTIRQHLRDVGRTAVSLLQSRISEGDTIENPRPAEVEMNGSPSQMSFPPVPTLIAPELIIRQSSLRRLSTR